MSEESTKETPVLETIEEEKEEVEQSSETSPPEEPSKKEKNPNRVKAAHKLAAKRQLLKEEKVRKKARDEMTKPSTWVMMGVVLTSIGFLGLYFSPLFPKEQEKPPKEEAKKESIPKSYFG